MRIDGDGAFVDVHAIDAAQRRQLQPRIANASLLEFDTTGEQNQAVSLFGPGVVAKSRVGPPAKAPAFAINGAGRRVDQVTPAFHRHDAISDEARFVRDALLGSGFASTIYSPLVGADAVADARPYALDSIRGADVVIYHFGIGSLVNDDLAKLRNRRTLWYHNITPAAYFRPYAPMIAHLIEEGRAQLRTVLPLVDTLIADSAFNADELRGLIDRPIDVVPFALDFRRFAAPADSGSLPPARGARWLTVGRLVPNKGLLRLVRAFAAYVRVHPDAQLVLAGAYRASDPFHLRLRFELDKLGIADSVVFTGSVTDGGLRALYESADIYVTLSEHEGFCVPVVEAMFFDVPVVASTAGALPETLGGAGLMVENGASAADIAALVNTVLSDERTRAALVDAQRRRREAFLPDATSTPLRKAIERALGQGMAHADCAMVMNPAS